MDKIFDKRPPCGYEHAQREALSLSIKIRILYFVGVVSGTRWTAPPRGTRVRSKDVVSSLPALKRTKTRWQRLNSLLWRRLDHFGFWTSGSSNHIGDLINIFLLYLVVMCAECMMLVHVRGRGWDEKRSRSSMAGECRKYTVYS